jgi:hypothetical protein
MATGLGGVLGGVHTISCAAASRKWPTTTGRLLSKDINWTGPEINVLHPEIRYEFFVNGKRYESGRVSFKQVGTSNPQDATAVLDSYKYETSIVVYYDPKNPKNAVLVPGIGLVCFLPVAFGVPIFIAGLLMIGCGSSE